MTAWLRVILATGILVIPGGLMFLLAYVAAYALWEAFQAARREHPGDVHLRDIWEAARFRDAWQHTRTLLHH
ncbi:MAG TPA: hypothetical protein VEY30_02610 [Myxococcaceae bacterium]|nr:hypothetical protein [Myxococcaceae bacterium]